MNYKLVVVQPFENYKKGDQIYDQNVIEKILDINHDHHHYNRNVRRVFMSDAEKQQLIAQAPIAIESNAAVPEKEDQNKSKASDENSVKMQSMKK